MRVKLTHDQVIVLRGALNKAGSKEIGGQIFGEQIAPSDFLVMELTCQTRLGTFARFIVDLVQAAKDALQFFERTGHCYSRFNYIGEWHSHPSFRVEPSETDISSMRAIVEDDDFNGNFAVLMIARIDDEKLTCGAWVFDPGGTEDFVTLELDR